MSKKQLCLFILIANSLHLQAQNLMGDFKPITPFIVGPTLSIIRIKRVNGTPFYDDAYHKGELWTANHFHFTDELVYAFDEVENTLLVKTKKDTAMYVNAALIDSFRLYVNDSTIVYYYKGAYLHNLDNKDKLFQVVYSSQKVFLCKIPHKTLHEKPYIGHIGDMNIKDEYLSHDAYFIKVGSKALEPFRLTKKDILKKLPQKRPQLQEEFEYIDFFEDITETKLIALIKKIGY